MAANATITAEQILEEVSRHLFEQVVNTTLGTIVAAPGSQAVTPGSMSNIYNGALLIIGAGANREIVTASAVTPTQFTATFTNAHAAIDAVIGATFSSGQTTDPLFTQAEMLGYLADVQNEFLLMTRIIFAATTKTLQTQVRYYDAPSDAVRVERLAIAGNHLWDTSQDDLDMEDPMWQTSDSGSVPKQWFQNKINNQKFGVKPVPAVGVVADIWYSQRGPQTLVLTDILMVPDPMTYILKWGVLERALSKDGEQRDDYLAQYCRRRFTVGLQLAARFMEGVQAALTNQQPTANAGA